MRSQGPTPHDVDAVFAALYARLEARGALSSRAWERAVRATADVGDRLDRVLVKLGLVSEEDLADALAAELDIERMRSSNAPADAYPLGEVTLAFLRANQLVPLTEDDHGRLLVAVADPIDLSGLVALGAALNRETTPLLALGAEVAALIDRLYDAEDDAALADLVGRSDDDVERLRDLASEAPIIRLVNELIETAVRGGASDLHLEWSDGGLNARLRVDGRLRDHRGLPADDAQAIISRIKIMARLDIAERRLPQDGRIKTTSGGREIDLRVSTLPSLDGEAVVLRILDQGRQPLALGDLGLDGDGLARFEAMLSRPNGVILVTGPTGSGKTTTLYAALRAIAHPERKCLTVEDPVEYRLPGAVQVQVKPDIGLSFAAALRAFLRHDPDIVMIGEIRDGETAKIATQAALTGHIVLSTLHTNSAAASIGRLLDMGVEDYLIASTLVGAVAQRLVRRLCPDCKTPTPSPPAGRLARSLTALSGEDAPRLWRAVGCDRCDGRGFRGRRAIVEAMPIDGAVAEAIQRRATAQEIDAIAAANGVTSLWDAGLALALKGETTVEEVARVTQER